MSISLLSLLFFVFCPAWAKEETKLFPSVFIGPSGSGGASLQEDLSYLINPALLAFHKKSKLAVNYSLQNKQHSAMISVLDLKTSLPIAVSYQRSWQDTFNNAKDSYWFFSSGLRLNPFISVGTAVKKDLLDKKSWTFNLAGLLKFQPQRSQNQLALGLYGNNLLTNERQILSGAAYYAWKKFFLSQVDISRSWTQWILKGSVQSLFHPFFSVKLGAFATMTKLDWKTIDKKVLSGGLSFNGPRFSIEYGGQKNQSDYQHSLTFLLKI